jgi:GT2 family glycosyltransferase
MPTGPIPRASIIVPAYRSEATIARSLRALLAQDFRDYEVIVVDSSPDDRTEELVRGQFPQTHYQHIRDRLLPHAARNRGVELARGETLVFTDPDIYAPVAWLSRLVSAQERLGGAAAGGLACYGRRWVELGMHMSKFDPWLPGGRERRVDICPTANMACPRSALAAAGGFPEETMLGDSVLSWRLSEMGVPIWFVPEAVVEHHHMGTWTELLRERFARGREFAALRMERGQWSRGRTLAHLSLTVVPLRLAHLVWRGARNAWRARLLAEYLRVSPVAITGQAAWLRGEAVAYLRALRRPRTFA